jgi:hypothetical protein
MESTNIGKGRLHRPPADHLLREKGHGLNHLPRHCHESFEWSQLAAVKVDQDGTSRIACLPKMSATSVDDTLSYGNNISCLHCCQHRLIVGRVSDLSPLVAAQNDLRYTVVFSEVGEGEDEAEGN